MVHEPWSASIGTADDHRKSGETLDKVREALRFAYRRTGKSAGELLLPYVKNTQIFYTPNVGYDPANAWPKINYWTTFTASGGYGNTWITPANANVYPAAEMPIVLDCMTWANAGNLLPATIGCGSNPSTRRPSSPSPRCPPARSISRGGR